MTAFALAYIDLIILFSQTWEEHLAHLCAVVLQLWKYGLIINRSECVLSDKNRLITWGMLWGGDS